jgi:hypothetical protein
MASDVVAESVSPEHAPTATIAVTGKAYGGGEFSNRTVYLESWFLIKFL